MPLAIDGERQWTSAFIRWFSQKGCLRDADQKITSYKSMVAKDVTLNADFSDSPSSVAKTPLCISRNI